MDDPEKERVRIEPGELVRAREPALVARRLVVQGSDVARECAPPSTPGLVHAAMAPTEAAAKPSNRRVLLILLGVVAGLGLALIGGLVAVASWNSTNAAGSGRSVRIPEDGEESLIEKGELDLVAPSVHGRAGGLLATEWSGTAIPWRLDAEGRLLLVTNRHVQSARELADEPELSVEFKGGVERRVVATGVADSLADLAVLVVETDGLSEGKHYRLLSPLGDSDWKSLAPGDAVVAVGSPHGYPQTQTFGRISALRDRIQAMEDGVRWIQVDCTVLPGNSGGPLLRAQDGNWRWIGVVTARGEVGIGFAIYSGDVTVARYRWTKGVPPRFDRPQQSSEEPMKAPIEEDELRNPRMGAGL